MLGKPSKLARASRTVPQIARTPAARVRAMKRTDLERLIQEGSEASPAVKKAARERLREMDKAEAAENAARSARQSQAQSKREVDMPKLKSEMAKGGYAKKKMAKGGYANCGASMAPTQASTKKMAMGGYARKK